MHFAYLYGFGCSHERQCDHQKCDVGATHDRVMWGEAGETPPSVSALRAGARSRWPRTTHWKFSKVSSQ